MNTSFMLLSEIAEEGEGDEGRGGGGGGRASFTNHTNNATLTFVEDELQAKAHEKQLLFSRLLVVNWLTALQRTLTSNTCQFLASFG